ncbi:Kelch repeat-containing protein [Anaeromicrobium sediminis]|uniref:Galactose oxidase n=1 Tax=Anaeromicrobium sediminis TaxID=1478221 RepID=A0A267MPE9_9FIRM|nr:kelch-like protein [Anaeromicrobium sediminis]PAB61302.1 hypothetical protein CCE28_02400 [Anaeromicrobium sediminis]
MANKSKVRSEGVSFSTRLFLAIIFILILKFTGEEVGINERMMIDSRSEIGVVAFNEKIYIIGGTEGSYPVGRVEEYDPVTKESVYKTSMTTKREALGIVELQGKIYAIGGMQEDVEYSNIVEEYDPITDKWRTKSPMITPRASVVAVKSNGKIYACGGYNDLGDSRSAAVIEEYNPITDTWRLVTEIPTKIESSGQAIAVNGKIYIIGGHFDSRLKVYDIETGEWSLKSSMQEGIQDFSVSKFNNKIYIFGGKYHLVDETQDLVLEYDIETDSWTRKTNMCIAREDAGAAELNGIIYVAGGYRYGEGGLRTIEEYNPITDTWLEFN